MSELKFQIAKLRNSKKLSGAEFAAMLTESSGKKYSRSHVNNWEQGQGIKGEDIVNICKCFHVTADSLLFKGPLEHRSDEQTIVDAAAFTGLSHKALTVLHDLHKLGYNADALNALLERISFYRTVLADVEQALYCLNRLPDEGYTPSPEEGEAAILLRQKGWIPLDPESAYRTIADRAGASMQLELGFIKSELESDTMKKHTEIDNQCFIDVLAERQTLRKEDS